MITCGIDYARWSDLLQYNPQVFLNEVACLVVFYLLAKIFLHQKPVHAKIHSDHRQTILLKTLLFFELLDFIEVLNWCLPGSALQGILAAHEFIAHNLWAINHGLLICIMMGIGLNRPNTGHLSGFKLKGLTTALN